MKMMKLSTAASLAALSMALAGCAIAPIPTAKNYPDAPQFRARSAGHWEQIANEAVTETLSQLSRSGAKGMPIYVELPDPASAFDKAFRDFVITDLVKRGETVELSPESAGVKVVYGAQIVKHRSEYPGDPSHTEFVLSTSITSRSAYVTRESDVYYLEDVDEFMLRPVSTPSSIVMKVVAQ